jgi:hypothetical protein
MSTNHHSILRSLDRFPFPAVADCPGLGQLVGPFVATDASVAGYVTPTHDQARVLESVQGISLGLSPHQSDSVPIRGAVDSEKCFF